MMFKNSVDAERMIFSLTGLYHLSPSINVGKPITLSLNTFIISAFSVAPLLYMLKWCNVSTVSTSHCRRSIYCPALWLRIRRIHGDFQFTQDFPLPECRIHSTKFTKVTGITHLCYVKVVL